jgi:hypothetical protein
VTIVKVATTVTFGWFIEARLEMLKIICCERTASLTLLFWKSSYNHRVADGY